MKLDAQTVVGAFKLFASRAPTPEEIHKFVSTGMTRNAVKAYIFENKLSKIPPEPEWTNAPSGVHWMSPWGWSSNGLCNVWRRQARALSDAGVLLRLSAFWRFGGNPDARAQAEAGYLTKVLATPKVRICGFPIEGEQPLANHILSTVRPKQIICSMMERDRIGPAAAAAANQVDWWLTCQANVDAFVRSGVDRARLKIVPVPFFPDDPALKLVGRQREPGAPRYYHIGSMCFRKGQDELLLGFLRAFKPGEAQLVIKTTISDPGYPNVFQLRTMHLADERVRANGWTAQNVNAPHVELVHATWSEDRLMELHRWGDVYLSVSKGEGWDMPAFAAVLAGNLLIYTPSGGPQEFACESDLLVRQTGWETVHPFYQKHYFFEKDSQWITYDTEHYVEQLQVSAGNLPPKEHRRDFTQFTAKVVGELMRSYVEPMLAD
jgi:hypothetical protein